MHRAALLLVSFAVLPLTACTIDRAVGSGWTVSPKLAENCRDQCARLDMRLGAVVLSGASGACVCEPAPSPGSPPRASLGGAAGAILIAASDEEASSQSRSDQPPGTIPGALPGTPPGTLPGVLPGSLPGSTPGTMPGAHH